MGIESFGEALDYIPDPRINRCECEGYPRTIRPGKLAEGAQWVVRCPRCTKRSEEGATRDDAIKLWNDGKYAESGIDEFPAEIEV